MPHLSPQDINLAGERAAHYRRRLAIIDGAPSEATLMERIEFVTAPAQPTKDPDWWSIGLVIDGIAECELAVFYNPTTRAVKVERPSEPEPRSSTNPASTFPHALTNKGVTASQAYRYYFEGKEYSPEEAGQLVRVRGTVGWRWEPK